MLAEIALPNKCLHALGMGDRRRKPAGDVVGDVSPADRHIIGKDQIAVEKHPDRRGPAAHVDDGHPETDLVLDKTREPRSIGADDESIDLEMRAPDSRAVIAYAGRARGHNMHVDPEPLPEHAARVADAAAVIDRKADRDRMDHLPVAGLAQQIAVLEDPPHIGVGDLASGDGDLGPDDPRRGEAARQVGDNPLYRVAGHLLGGVHGVQTPKRPPLRDR